MAFTPKSTESSRRVRAAAPAMPRAMPARASPIPWREDAEALGAERLADGDLACALDDGVGDDAVETEHREQRGGNGECTEQREHETALVL